MPQSKRRHGSGGGRCHGVTERGIRRRRGRNRRPGSGVDEPETGVLGKSRGSRHSKGPQSTHPRIQGLERLRRSCDGLAAAEAREILAQEDGLHGLEAPLRHLFGVVVSMCCCCFESVSRGLRNSPASPPATQIRAVGFPECDPLGYRGAAWPQPPWRTLIHPPSLRQRIGGE